MKRVKWKGDLKKKKNAFWANFRFYWVFSSWIQALRHNRWDSFIFSIIAFSHKANHQSCNNFLFHGTSHWKRCGPDAVAFPSLIVCAAKTTFFRASPQVTKAPGLLTRAVRGRLWRKKWSPTWEFESLRGRLIQWLGMLKGGLSELRANFGLLAGNMPARKPLTALFCVFFVKIPV